MDKYDFGNRLYELRTKKGITQEKLGKMLGVSNKAISKWENGTTQPRLQMLDKIAACFDMSVEELLEKSDTNPVNPDETETEEAKEFNWKGYIKRKRILFLAVSVIIVANIFFLFYKLLVETDSPRDAMCYIYIVQPILVVILIHVFVSNFVFFMTLLKNQNSIKEYGEVKKANYKEKRVIIGIKRVLCLSLVCFIMLGFYFGLMNSKKGTAIKTQLDKPITQLCNSENDVSNMMALEDSFLCYDCGCIKNLKRYSYNDSFAHKNVTYINGAPSWYIKKYSGDEIDYISRGTKTYDHSTDVKTIEKNGLRLVYTIDDDLSNMELVAYSKHRCVQISIGGPQGSDLTVDENKIINYAYSFFK